MAHYHLYYLRKNKLVGSDHIEAADDNEAVRIAQRKGSGQVVEIWDGHKRVRVTAPMNAASVSQ